MTRSAAVLPAVTFALSFAFAYGPEALRMSLPAALAVSAAAAAVVWLSGRRPGAALAAVVALAVALPVLRSTFQGLDLVVALAVFRAAADSRLRPVLPAVAGLVALTVNDVWQRVALDLPFATPGVLLPALLTALAVGLGLQTRRVRAQHAELVALREADRHRAVSEQRRRIARDLHDVAAHHLTAVVVRTKVAGQRAAAPRAGTLLGVGPAGRRDGRADRGGRRAVGGRARPGRVRADRDARAGRGLRRVSHRRPVTPRRLADPRGDPGGSTMTGPAAGGGPVAGGGVAGSGRGVVVRLGVADDDARVRRDLCALLDLEPDLEVVAAVGDGAAAVLVADRLRPDVVVMDVRMPVLDGIEATRRLRRRHGDRCRVLVVTTFDLDEHVLGAVRAGVAGFLVKDRAPEQLADAVRTVAAGDAVVSPRATARLLREFVPPALDGPAPAGLTDREADLVRLLARGLSNDQIAAAAHISRATVKTHVSSILTKLGLASRLQVVVRAYDHGLVTFDRGP